MLSRFLIGVIIFERKGEAEAFKNVPPMCKTAGQ
jgi:hypothetical protein